jgi:hypothetical protein
VARIGAVKRTLLIVAGGVVIAVAGGVGAVVLHGRGGATAEDIAHVRLDVTADELVDMLPRSHAVHHEVETRLRHDVVGFEEVTFTFGGPAQHVSGMKLVRAEEEGKARKSGHDDQLLDRRFAQLANASENEMKRGNVRFRLSPTDLAFDVDVGRRDLDADARVAVARDVLLSIAFGTPPKHTDKEVADALGTGYPVSDVARARLTFDKRESMDALMAQFPGSTRNEKSVRIPLVHPLIEDVEPRWKTRSYANATYLHIDFHMLNEFRDARALAACIAKQPAGPLLEVREAYGLGAFEETEPAAFASIMQAVDACR